MPTRNAEGSALTLSHLPMTFSVCRFSPAAELPAGLWQQRWVFPARTDEELSLVCPDTLIDKGGLEPEQRSAGWRAFKVEGPLAFELIGILAGIAQVLASAEISLFALSTFDTDYVLVQGTDGERAISALTGAGYKVLDAPAVR